ncbi:GntR family transcriptional regulator [Rhodoplanes azumiensis]|uniref:GntR family transcriptional regulator n=1 Tax=Rhodoplanes azumiensis TaxID=1897628 RepID=A0ABW5APW0_9BRAD
MHAASDAVGSDQRLPIYQRLKDALAERIQDGAWKPGEAIPAESDLASEFGVALGTMRKAIEGLVQQGLLERQQGRGTFVRRADLGNTLFRFFRHTGKGGRPVVPTQRLVGRRTAAAGREAARALGLTADDPVLWLKRLRLVDGAPLVVDEIALPLPRFQALATLAPEKFEGLLYPLYEREIGITVARATDRIAFGRATASVAKALGIAAGEPVVVIDRTAFGLDGVPLEWRRSHGPADRFSYDVEIR